jgi:hypothetical protein
MTKYSMTPISNGTRRRKDHTTFAQHVEPSVNKGALVVGDELWEAPADGPEVKKGDKWLNIISVDGVPVNEDLWMAYIHKGVQICNNFKVIADEGDPEPTPTPEVIYPDALEITPLDKNNQPIAPKKIYKVA